MRPEASSALVPPSRNPPTVAIPNALVNGVAGAIGDPPPAVTLSVTVTFGTGLRNASRTSTDGSVDTARPTRAVWLLPPFTAIDAAAAAFTVTGAVCEIGMTPEPPLPVADMALASALVELNVVVNTPLALAVPDEDVNALFVPLAATVTAALPIGLPNPSRTVTVIVEAVDPAEHPVEHAAIAAVVATTVDWV